MVAQMTEWILEMLRYYGGWSVFMGVLIEQVIIPIPSPAIIMGAGFILIPAGLEWGPAIWQMCVEIVFPGTVAATMGAVGLYYIGLWGGRRVTEKFEKFLGFGWKDVESLGSHMSTRGEAVFLFFARALPIVPLSLVSLGAGVLKVPFRTFLLWSVLGSLPRCLILSVLGWQLGASAEGWAKGVNRFESMLSLGIAALGIGVILYLRRRVRSGMNIS